MVIEKWIHPGAHPPALEAGNKIACGHTKTPRENLSGFLNLYFFKYTFWFFTNWANIAIGFFCNIPFINISANCTSVR